MNAKHRILVIGCGSVGRRHARLLVQRRDTAVYLADPVKANIDECASSADVEGSFRDYREALGKGMDGVFVCTPNEMHAGMAIEALDAGCCALVEKPVATSVAEAEGILRHERPGKRRVLVGYMNRFSEQLQQVKAMLEAGELENIVYAQACVYTYATLLNARTPFREEQEWSLVADYTHEIDFLRYLVGEVQGVFAMADTLGAKEHTARPNVMEMILRFRNRAIGSIHMDYVRDPDKRTLEVVGDKGSLELQLNDGILRAFRAGQKGFRETRVPFVRDELFSKQIDNFIGMVRGEQEPMTTLEDGIEVLKIMEAAIRSCKEKAMVEIPCSA